MNIRPSLDEIGLGGGTDDEQVRRQGEREYLGQPDVAQTNMATVRPCQSCPADVELLPNRAPVRLGDAPGAHRRRIRPPDEIVCAGGKASQLSRMGLFPRKGYRGVWAELTAALDGLGLDVPAAKALRNLRRRVGVRPVRMLFGVLAAPLGQPRTPGVMFGRYRTVAFDGCRSIKVPDTDRNRGWLGKLKAALGETGYPVI